jgi:hypothetical protein
MRDLIPQPPKGTMQDRGISADVRLEGQIHPMHDWSATGVSFDTPQAPLQTGDAVKLTLRFHLPEESVGVWVDGKVIRSEGGETAVEFDDLTAYAQRRLARVIDGLAAKPLESMLMPFNNL